MMKSALSAEDIAYWYMRLNGFLILRNFLIHGDDANPRGEVDLIGARFRFRKEHLAEPLPDDKWITGLDTTIIAFCEVKAGAGGFNPSWKSAERKIMESFLALVGILPSKEWGGAAHQLYENGRFDSQSGLLITMVLFHGGKDATQDDRWKDVPSFHFRELLPFIHQRFCAFEKIKLDHSQWDKSGHRLWDAYLAHRRDCAGFTEAVVREIGAS